MKRLFGFFSLLFVSVFTYGQAQEGTVEYQKKLQPAAVIELAYPMSVVNEAMNEYMSRSGKSRKNNSDGFSSYRNTDAVSGDSTNADLLFHSQRKSRKEKDITVLSLLVVPNEAQASTGNMHYLSMDSAKVYLDALAIAIDAHNVQLKIKDQNNEVAKAEAKHKSLVKEGEDLEERRVALEKKIAGNKNDQQQQLKEIENQKLRLSNWVEKRKM